MLMMLPPEKIGHLSGCCFLVHYKNQQCHKHKSLMTKGPIPAAKPPAPPPPPIGGIRMRKYEIMKNAALEKHHSSKKGRVNSRNTFQKISEYTSSMISRSYGNEGGVGVNPPSLGAFSSRKKRVECVAPWGPAATPQAIPCFGFLDGRIREWGRQVGAAGHEKIADRIYGNVIGNSTNH